MKNIIYTLLITLLFTACNSDNNESLDPVGAILLTPISAESCVNGDETQDNQISVLFSWANAANTDLYELVLEDSADNSIVNFLTDDNEIMINLNKESTYSWFVISKSVSTSNTAVSEEWEFTTIGEAPLFEYIPSPVTLFSPEMGFNFQGVTNVTLNWIASSFGPPIDKFEIFIDTSLPLSLTNPIVINSDQIGQGLNVVNVSPGNIYYWRVKTIDVSGNSSLSSVFEFRVD